jgi:ribosomal protein S26
MGKRSRGRTDYVSCDKCGMRVARSKAHIVYRREGKNYYCVRCSKKAKITGRGRIMYRSGRRDR